MKRIQQIDPIKDSFLRFEQRQSLQTFMVNTLKDYLRTEYHIYEQAKDKDEFARALLQTAMGAIVLSANVPVNLTTLWESVPTPIGNGRRPTRFGSWLCAAISNYNRMSVEEVAEVVRLARAKVDGE